MSYNRISKLKGITLVELMVSVVIFSLMSIALGIILNIGLKSWRDIDGKVDAESGLNNAVKDINESIRNSRYIMISSDNINNGDVTKVGYLILPSYVTYNNDLINEQEFNFVFSSSVDNTGNVHFDSSYKSNFIIVYFVAKPNNCSKCNDMFGGDLGVNCPHKMLVKKWYKLVNSSVQNDVPVSVWSNTELFKINSANGYGLDNFMTNRSPYDKILSQNIMTFGSYLDTVSHMVSYRIKAFKPNMSKIKPKKDDIIASVHAFYGETYNNPDTGYVSESDPLRKYCIEIRATVAPLNQ